jgi:hypothetical protein
MSTRVGQTIADQIGARAFLMMGARDVLASARGLQFKVGRNAKRVAAVQVNLDDDDTYTVTFWAGRGLDWRAIGEVSMVHADSLRRVLEDGTGLYLSL